MEGASCSWRCCCSSQSFSASSPAGKPFQTSVLGRGWCDRLRPVDRRFLVRPQPARARLARQVDRVGPTGGGWCRYRTRATLVGAPATGESAEKRGAWRCGPPGACLPSPTPAQGCLDNKLLAAVHGVLGPWRIGRRRPADSAAGLGRRWGGRWDLNPQPLGPQPRALPVELRPPGRLSGHRPLGSAARDRVLQPATLAEAGAGANSGRGGGSLRVRSLAGRSRSAGPPAAIHRSRPDGPAPASSAVFPLTASRAVAFFVACLPMT